MRVVFVASLGLVPPMLAAQVEVVRAPAAERMPAIPVAEVEAGQRGYGLSVFRGAEAERFEVEVLGVMRDLAPGTSFILGKLTGQGLERDGVIAGMSGSPVYIDGRLAGAVAFGWGFSNDAVAGITPIEFMRELSTTSDSAAQSWASVLPSDSNPVPAANSDFDLSALVERPGLARAREILGASLASLMPAQALDGAGGRARASSGLVLGIGGFSDVSHGLFSAAVPVVQSGSNPSLVSDLVPGSAVAGVLVGGDLQVSVTGTVTDRTGDEVLGFGHPYLGLGPVSIPMASAEVVTVLSSQVNSFKISNTGPVVGAFEQDREPGLRGRIGAEARTVPLGISVHGLAERDYSMTLADLPQVAPSLVAMSAIEAMNVSSYISGAQTVTAQARFQLAGHRDLELRGVWDGLGASIESAVYLLQMTGFLVNNPWETIVVEAIEFDFHQQAGQRSASLLGAHAERSDVTPGDRVGIVLDLEAFQGQRFQERVEVIIPDDAVPGLYYLFVGDGQSVGSTRIQIEPPGQLGLEGALDFVSSFEARDRIVVLGAARASGVLAGAESLPELPGSVASIFQASSTFGARRLPLAITQREVFALDRPFDGLVRLDLKVKGDGQ